MNIKLLLLASAGIVVYGARKHPTLSLKKRPLYIRVSYANLCDDNPFDITEGNITITHEGTKVLVSTYGYLHRRVERIEKIIVTVRQCRDRAGESSCELFQTWRVGKESCVMVEQKNMMWSTLFDASEPKVKCPLQKGEYRIRNASMDAEPVEKVFSVIPMEKYFWRVRIETYDFEKVFCLEFGVNYLRGKF